MKELRPLTPDVKLRAVRKNGSYLHISITSPNYNIYFNIYGGKSLQNVFFEKNRKKIQFALFRKWTLFKSSRLLELTMFFSGFFGSRSETSFSGH